MRATILSDIEDGRCHGVALRVARHGSIVLDVCEGHADRATGTTLQPDRTGGVDQDTPLQVGELIYTCSRTDRLAARKGW